MKKEFKSIISCDDSNIKPLKKGNAVHDLYRLVLNNMNPKAMLCFYLDSNDEYQEAEKFIQNAKILHIKDLYGKKHFVSDIKNLDLKQSV